MSHITAEQNQAIDAIEETIRNLRLGYISPFRAWTNITSAIQSAEEPAEPDAPSELGDMWVEGTVKATVEYRIKGTDDEDVARADYRALVEQRFDSIGAAVFDIAIEEVKPAD